MVAEHRLCTHEVAPLPDIPRHDHHSSPPREVLPALAPTPMVRSRAAEEPKNFEDAVRRIDEIAEVTQSTPLSLVLIVLLGAGKWEG